MKKTIAIVCIMAVLASFAGCGKTSENTQSNTAETSVATTAVTTTSISSDSSDTSSEAETTTTTEATTTTTAATTTTQAATHKSSATITKSAAKATTKKVKSVQTARVAQVTQQTQSPAPAVTTARVTVRKVVTTTAAKTTTAKKKVVTTAKKSTAKVSKVLKAYEKWILGTTTAADREVIRQDMIKAIKKQYPKAKLNESLYAWAGNTKDEAKANYKFGNANFEAGGSSDTQSQMYYLPEIFGKHDLLSLAKDLQKKTTTEWGTHSSVEDGFNIEIYKDKGTIDFYTGKSIPDYVLVVLT